jgi:hypothetical protein
MATTAEALPRSASEAETLAQNFLSRKEQRAAAFRLTPFHSVRLSRLMGETRATADAPYYIFNREEGGFVIVSGTDLMRPILGYSDDQTFSDEALPDNLESWLTHLAESVTYVEAHPEAALSAEAPSYAPIAPLNNIQWDQNDPYSNRCPNQYPTGCMATALAQVMRHHKYPEHGQGINSYTTAGNTVSVNFADQTYDWDLMLEQYTGSETQAQRDEVAKLSFHCGVALNMSYAADQSGSTAPYYLKALIDYFGYNELTTLQYRSYYSYDEWNALLYNELQENRPILYSGLASTGGHAFILDGYSSEGYYHVNWGWSGQYNGYYDVCILNPLGVGTGATASNGYSSEQSAVLQLTPQQHYGRYFAPIAGESITSSTKKTTLGGRVNLVLKSLFNYSPFAVNGAVGAMIVPTDSETQNPADDANRILCPLGTLTIAASGTSIIGSNISGQITLPSDLAEGSYRIYTYYHPSDNDSIATLRYTASAHSYLDMTVSGTSVTISKSTDQPLTAANWSFENSTVSANTATTITVDVTNTGTETVVGSFALALTNPDEVSEKITQSLPTTLKAGETKQLSFDCTLSMSGTWGASLQYAHQNVSTSMVTIATSRTTFEVQEDLTTNAAFTLLSTPWITSESTRELGSELTIAAVVKNTGDRYVGTFRVQFFRTTTAQTALLTFEQECEVAAGATDTIYISGTLQNLNAQTTYYGKVSYLKSGNYAMPSINAGVQNRVAVNVLAATGIEDVRIDHASDQVEIYDLTGRLIGVQQRQNTPVGYQLPRGIYIIDRHKVVVQ